MNGYRVVSEQGKCLHEQAYGLAPRDGGEILGVIPSVEDTEFGWCGRCGAVHVKRRDREGYWTEPTYGKPHDDILTDSMVFEFEGRVVKLTDGLLEALMRLGIQVATGETP